MTRMPSMCLIVYIRWPLVPQQYKNQCWAAI